MSKVKPCRMAIGKLQPYDVLDVYDRCTSLLAVSIDVARIDVGKLKTTMSRRELIVFR